MFEFLLGWLSICDLYAA